MATLHHYPFCPRSRFIRLIFGEMGMNPTLIEEKPWERRHEFLLLDPSGETPVLVEEAGLVVPGPQVISEYLDETRGMALGAQRLLPENPAGRVEVRRLMDWFLIKFNAEVTDYLVTEKIFKRFNRSEEGTSSPNMHAIRAARSNIRYHLKYIGFLLSRRDWLAGNAISYADLAAAAMLSVADYLGDVPWEEDEAAKHWYAKVKSRPSFRSVLADRVAGMAPPTYYGNPDF